MTRERRIPNIHLEAGPVPANSPYLPDFDPSPAGQRPGRPAPIDTSVTVPVREHARYWFDDRDVFQTSVATPAPPVKPANIPGDAVEHAADIEDLPDDARARIVAARRSAAEALAAAAESTLLAMPVCSRVNG